MEKSTFTYTNHEHMKACFNYLPADILQFVYVDQMDLFILSMKSGAKGLHTINYQAEETNGFYVWLKANFVKEGTIDEITYCGLNETDAEMDRLCQAVYSALAVN